MLPSRRGAASAEPPLPACARRCATRAGAISKVRHEFSVVAPHSAGGSPDCDEPGAAGALGLRTQGAARAAGGLDLSPSISQSDLSMTGFSYQRGILHAEGVPLPRIAEAVGTPAYVYSSGVLTER